MEALQKLELRKMFNARTKYILAPFEKRRKLILFKAFFIAFIGLLIGTIIIVLFMQYDATVTSHNDKIGKGYKLPFFIIIGSFVWAGAILKEYRDKIKKSTYNAIFKCMNLKHSIATGVNEITNLLSSTNFLGNFTKVTTDDHFRGELKNISFDLIETEVVRGSGRNQTTLFRGMALIVDSNKKFEKMTFIKSDKGLFNSSMFNNCQPVRLEDNQFEKEFEVYSQDQIEARYLLTTAFMERMLNYKRKNNRKIETIFADNKIVFLVPALFDKFEVSIFKTIINFNKFYKVIEEVEELLEIIETLKLEQRIGL